MAPFIWPSLDLLSHPKQFWRAMGGSRLAELGAEQHRYSEKVLQGLVVAKPCLTSCDPLDCSPPGFSGHGILQESILEWVAISFSSGFPDPGIKPASPVSPALAGWIFTTEPPRKPTGA